MTVPAAGGVTNFDAAPSRRRRRQAVVAMNEINNKQGNNSARKCPLRVPQSRLSFRICFFYQLSLQMSIWW